MAATLIVAESEPVTITEWHGKVPAKAFLKLQNAGKEMLPEDELLLASTTDSDMIEAIVTVANDGTLLQAKANPFVMHDRSVVVTPWERVPGRFWGRGVAEKGFNPQKALDAELRSRQDALGFISAPMIGVDAGRLPRGMRMEVKPGKVWLTNGNPDEVLRPVKFGNLEASTFNQTQEMERMVQMGTGAFDTAQALKSGQTQSGANSVSSNSAMMGSFVKRAKRSARTIENGLVKPMVRKMLNRYMQFAPRRYPADFQFKVNAAMGIMAREVESMQLTQLLGMMPQEVAPQVALGVTKGIVDLSSVTNKTEIKALIDQALQPPSEEDQERARQIEEARVALELASLRAGAEGAFLENEKTIAETKKLLNEGLLALEKSGFEAEKLNQERARIMLQIEELNEQRNANQLDRERLRLDARRVDIEEKKVSQGTTNE